MVCVQFIQMLNVKTTLILSLICSAEKIQRSQATVGKYDGKHPALTCATTAGKIFLHNPHLHGVADNHITYLNINKQITAVLAGNIDPKNVKDVLFVGTPSTLQCYDVDQNKDLFFKDITDGVNVVVVGQLASFKKPLAIVGGNCSIQVRHAACLTHGRCHAPCKHALTGHRWRVPSVCYCKHALTEIATCMPSKIAIILCVTGTESSTWVAGQGQQNILIHNAIWLQGFEADGTESFWTVTGDNVSAMTLCDVDGDGRPELLVSSMLSTFLHAAEWATGGIIMFS